MVNKIINEFGLEDVGDVEVGIEIEMEGRALQFQEKEGDPWRQAYDGSLRGDSIEYVLYKPIKRDEIGKALRRLKEILKDNPNTRLTPSDRCGVHIHINVQQLTIKQVFNFITLYLILENVLVHYCGPTREGNLFCLRGKDADFLIEALIRGKQQHSLAELQANTFRYASINIGALSKFGSLEFRALQTPKNLSDIETWAKMLLTIKDHALTINDGSEIVDQFSLDGADVFVHKIFGDLAQLLMVEGYEQRMYQGARMVQDIAYTPLGRRRTSNKKRTAPGFNPTIYQPASLEWTNNTNLTTADIEVVAGGERQPVRRIRRNPDPMAATTETNTGIPYIVEEEAGDVPVYIEDPPIAPGHERNRQRVGITGRDLEELRVMRERRRGTEE